MSAKLSLLAWRAAIAALVIIGFLIGAPRVALADGSDWTLTEASGDVQLQQGPDGWTLIANSSALRPGSILKTGGNGRAVLTNNGDRIVVAPNNYLELPAGSAGDSAHVRQGAGTLLYDMVPRAADRFRVDTPYLAAVIKGTIFTVAVDQSGAAVHVVRGVVQVSNALGQQATLVYPGQTAEVLGRGQGDVRVLGRQNSATSASASGALATRSASADDASASGASGGSGITQSLTSRTESIATLTDGLLPNLATGSVPSRAPGASGGDDGSVASTRGNGNGNGVNNGNDGNGNGIGNADAYGRSGNANYNAAINANSNAGGNGKGSANAGGNGNANSNAGGNGNGNTNAGGNSNAGGNGNGNANAGGNSNAGGNGNGNANAGGNSNAGGNGNGKGAVAKK